ncbi:hypothetical protein GCM10028808_30810 [Spirosoma migulaei]
MRLNFSIWLRVLALFILLTSCEDHRIPSAQRFRIKRVSYKHINDTNRSYNTFNYSIEGRLDSITSGYIGTNWISVNGRKLLYYNEQGKLIKIERQFKAGTGMAVYTPGEYVADMRYYYTYDEGGKLISVYTEQVSDIDKFARFAGQWNFDYKDGDKVPSRVISISGGPVSSGRAVYAYNYYTYDKGNVVTREQSNQPKSGIYPPETFQYDDRPNLLYGLMYGVFYTHDLIDLYDDIRAFSQNNAMLSHEIYTYDSNGLLTKATQRDGNYEIIYEYESY